MIDTTPTIIELSTAQFNTNIAYVRSLVAPQTHVALVIKGNGYGHGMLEMARLCQDNSDVNGVCVTLLSEALQLRAMGFTKPILVLAFIDADPALAVTHSISLIVQDMPTILEINAAAQQLNKKALIHIKIDTGLSRLGFHPEEIMLSINEIAQLPFITIEGISSHFAESDNLSSAFTAEQCAKFTTLIHQLEKANISIPFKHTANSSGMLFHSESIFNFVRIGGAAYGILAPKADRPLAPIATWKTKIAFIRTIEAGAFVSYARTFQTTHATRTAILPIGYFHGYSRRLGNKGTVLIKTENGLHPAPVIGRVCMNQIIIDITHIPDARIGTQALLLGPYREIHPYELAQRTESFNPREITTCLNGIIARRIVEQPIILAATQQSAQTSRQPESIGS